MISDEFLSILACPETKQKLRLAEATVLDKVKVKVENGALKNLSGLNVTGPVTDVLLREDGSILYVVRDGIPILLIEEGIKADQL